jgi:tripartite-type tricarboxylate transporter receptor subunit TctC
MAGVDLVHVPYRGGPQALPDLISGRVDMYLGTIAVALASIRSGSVRALAVTGRTRSDGTIGESVPGYEVSAVDGIGVRKGTPPEIIETLNREINAGLNDSVVKTRLADMLAIPMPLTPAQFSALLAAENEKWGKLIRAANIKL